MKAREKACEHCGAVFSKDGKLSFKQWEKTRFCSILCRDASHTKHQRAKQPPIDQAFASNIEKSSDCWNWIGALGPDGYGRITYSGKQYRPHVLSMILSGVEPRKGEMVCHRCDNKRCVNPNHLYLGNAKTNSRDAVERGLLCTGEAHHRAKLTDARVREMRALHASGNFSIQKIADCYGVTRITASRAISGKTWRQVI